MKIHTPKNGYKRLPSGRRLEQSRGDLDEGDFSRNNQLFFGLKHLYRGIINPQETAHV